MDKSEAQAILGEQLGRFGSYAELLPFVASKRVETFEVRGASGTNYQIEIQFFWDDKPSGDIRVVGSIDDGGLRAFVPLTQDLLILRPESLSYEPSA
jgi:hypothetical protein